MDIAGILDASAARVPRVAAPWLGVLWLTALPARLTLVYLFHEIMRLDDPGQYRHFLLRLALLQFACEILAFYGRAVFVRALALNDVQSPDAGRAPLFPPLVDLLAYLYVALLIDFLFYLSFLTLIGPPILIMAAGLAAAASPGMGKQGLLGAPSAVCGLFRRILELCAINLVFAFAFLLANVNVFALVEVLLWLGAPLFGSTLPRWEHIFEPYASVFAKHALTASLIAMLAALLVEPFWLAANLEFVQRVRARKTGDDLRLWFKALRARGGPAA
jgi:hypothetical protein